MFKETNVCGVVCAFGAQVTCDLAVTLRIRAEEILFSLEPDADIGRFDCKRLHFDLIPFYDFIRSKILFDLRHMQFCSSTVADFQFCNQYCNCMHLECAGVKYDTGGNASTKNGPDIVSLPVSLQKLHKIEYTYYNSSHTINIDT